MLPSDENSRPTWMAPLSRADLVSGPPASSALKSLNLRPYVVSSPFWQNTRVGHSGGPPSVIWPATGARSDTFFRLFLVAVSLVTAKAFWSAAGDGVSTLMFFGVYRPRSFDTVSWTSPLA